MSKSKAPKIIGIVVAALLLIGGGVAGGLLLTKKNEKGTNNNSTQQTVSENKPAETVAEKTVAKTGVCNAGEIKKLGAGTYTVGQDIASGEYTVQNDNKKDAPYVSLFVYPSKTSYASDEFNNNQIAIFESSETKSLKLDEGNYMRVVYGGKLTCQ